MDVVVNWWAILAAAVAYMIVGAIVYAPPVLGKIWMDGVGMTEAKMKEMAKKSMAKAYAGTFVMYLVMGYVMSQLLAWAGASTWQAGVQVAFWVWLGFVATVLFGNSLWDTRKVSVAFVAMTYHLVGMLLMGGILVAWS